MSSYHKVEASELEVGDECTIVSPSIASFDWIVVEKGVSNVCIQPKSHSGKIAIFPVPLDQKVYKKSENKADDEQFKDQLKYGIKPTEFKIECSICGDALRDTSRLDVFNKAVEKYGWEYAEVDGMTLWKCHRDSCSQFSNPKQKEKNQ
jgi:hypothetical protein